MYGLNVVVMLNYEVYSDDDDDGDDDVWIVIWFWKRLRDDGEGLWFCLWWLLFVESGDYGGYGGWSKRDGYGVYVKELKVVVV
jgi:hypothetical protein